MENFTSEILTTTDSKADLIDALANAISVYNQHYDGDLDLLMLDRLKMIVKSIELEDKDDNSH